MKRITMNGILAIICQQCSLSINLIMLKSKKENALNVFLDIYWQIIMYLHMNQIVIVMIKILDCAIHAWQLLYRFKRYKI